MLIHQNQIRSDQAAAALIRQSEDAFMSQLNNVAMLVHNAPHVRILTLAGPTCSGKTTAARVITEVLHTFGKKLSVISIDDFYRERNDNETEHGKMDFESIASIDLPYFSRCISEICNGQTAQIPRFDFVRGYRTGYSALTVGDDALIMLEGIQALYPQITALLPREQTRSIFISPEEGIETGSISFTPTELRLMRRIVRDARERGASAERTFSIWPSVIENEQTNIFPYSKQTDIRINSTLAYEPFVIAPYVYRVLLNMPHSTPYEKIRNTLAGKCERVPTISPAPVPKASFFREFIG